MCHFRKRRDIRHLTGGVAHALGIDSLGAVIHQGGHIGCRRGRRNPDFDAETAQGASEQIVCPSVEQRRRHDIVTLRSQACQHSDYRRHSR